MTWFLRIFGIGSTCFVNSDFVASLIQKSFQADRHWYIIGILANLMNGNGRINIAKIIQQSISAKSENRKSSRISLHLPMEFSFSRSSGHRLAYMIDLCEDGLLLHTAEKLEMGQTLRIQLYYHSAEGLDRLQAIGEVLRVDRLGKNGKEYSCAVRFSDVSSGVLKKLRKFLKSLY